MDLTVSHIVNPFYDLHLEYLYTDEHQPVKQNHEHEMKGKSIKLSFNRHVLNFSSHTNDGKTFLLANNFLFNYTGNFNKRADEILSN